MPEELFTLDDLIVRPSESLKQAMQRMTHNRRGVLFVCDEDAHLVGVLSDGDVRRSLLEDTLLISPVSKIMNTDPVTAARLDEAKQLLRKLAVVAVPVVDRDGRILEAAVEGYDNTITLAASLQCAGDSQFTKPGVVAVIPARGGSKRIRRKNLATLAGRSLLNWAIRAAKEATQVAHIVVSTDDSGIADEARRLGVDVPWLRPAHLSMDDSPTIGALEHAVSWAKANLDPKPEFGVLLEPTAPLRRGDHIDAAIDLLRNSDADCVMSVSEIPHLFHPEELLTIADGVLQPYLPYRTMNTRKLRGEQSSVYVPNGLVYAFRTERLLENHNLYGKTTIPLITPWEEFLDIDTEQDLRLAELRLRQQ